jgi:hypothetical protein
MNTLPEWFTVEPKAEYTVKDLSGTSKKITGNKLHAGLPVNLAANEEVRLLIEP